MSNFSYKKALENIKGNEKQKIQTEHQKKVDEFKCKLIMLKELCEESLSKKQLSFNKDIDWKYPANYVVHFKKDIVEDVQEILNDLKETNEGIEDFMSIITLKYCKGKQDGEWWYEFVCGNSVDTFDFTQLDYSNIENSNRFCILFSYDSRWISF